MHLRHFAVGDLRSCTEFKYLTQCVLYINSQVLCRDYRPIIFSHAKRIAVQPITLLVYCPLAGFVLLRQFEKVALPQRSDHTARRDLRQAWVSAHLVSVVYYGSSRMMGRGSASVRRSTSVSGGYKFFRHRLNATLSSCHAPFKCHGLANACRKYRATVTFHTTQLVSPGRCFSVAPYLASSSPTNQQGGYITTSWTHFATGSSTGFAAPSSTCECRAAADGWGVGIDGCRHTAIYQGTAVSSAHNRYERWKRAL